MSPPEITWKPPRNAVVRTVRIGGMSKQQLLVDLQRKNIELNEAGWELFAHEKFTTSEARSMLETVEISIAELGWAQGATFAQIGARAAELGLSLCPLEVGPHLRLQFLDQPEGQAGHPPSQHRAPPGSITIASQPLTEEDAIPKGFYLRRMEGVLWLRGYWSEREHIYSPDDHFVFCRPQNAA